jgi:hypothetical protein
MRRFVAILSTVVAVLGMSTVFAPGASAEQCGWYKEGRVGYHKNCGDAFILVKHHWDTGDTGTNCQGPWSTITYYPDGPHEVTMAYYVNTPPETMVDQSGHRICRLGQPNV